MEKSRFLQMPSGRSPDSPSETRIQFHQDQIHLLVVHETQLAIYDTNKLDCVHQVIFPRKHRLDFSFLEMLVCYAKFNISRYVVGPT